MQSNKTGKPKTKAQLKTVRKAERFYEPYNKNNAMMLLYNRVKLAQIVESMKPAI